MYTQENSNHIRLHLRAIMALDHSRLGLENKFFENKSGRIFCVRQVYFTKSCQQIWVRVRTNLLYFLYITSELKQYYEALFVSHQYFTVFQDKLYSFNIQAYRSTRGHLAKPIQKIFKITYTASRFSLLTSAKFAVNINRVTLQRHKEFIVFIFFHSFITLCNLKKRLMLAAFWLLPFCKRCSWTTENKRQSD